MRQVSSVTPDWKREVPRCFWDPGRKLLKSIRDYQRFHLRSGLVDNFLTKACVIRHMFWSMVSGADIPLNSILGGGLLIPHPNGIVIHPEAQIGINCLIHQQVTIGVARSSEKPPQIGGHVDIGAGVKIIGNVTLGDHVKIGANAVVLDNIPDNCTAVGIPAKVIRK